MEEVEEMTMMWPSPSCLMLQKTRRNQLKFLPFKSKYTTSPKVKLHNCNVWF
uniref:Uncharacterized protein n=1 Tax=Arundo donax TaxID=35708 RepID=A0A0A9FL98_ARUDO